MSDLKQSITTHRNDCNHRVAVDNLQVDSTENCSTGIHSLRNS